MNNRLLKFVKKNKDKIRENMIIDLYNGDAMYENISCTITTRCYEGNNQFVFVKGNKKVSE